MKQLLAVSKFNRFYVRRLLNMIHREYASHGGAPTTTLEAVLFGHVADVAFLRVGFCNGKDSYNGSIVGYWFTSVESFLSDALITAPLANDEQFMSRTMEIVLYHTKTGMVAWRPGADGTIVDSFVARMPVALGVIPV